jgi:peptidoglycan/LPS O-acetylase OafA/YrhL
LTISTLEKTQSTISTGRFYRPELDALRFFAFFLVFFSHAIPLKGHSPHWVVALRMACAFGVPIFFCLSAYLITELLFREIRIAGSINTRAFYTRRALRIWPLYFAALFIGFGLARVFGQPMSLAYLASYLLLAGNWYSVMGGFVATGMEHLWSITVEEQFYLVWPWLVSRLSRRGLGFASLAFWCVSQIAILFLCTRNVAIDPGIWKNSLVQFQYFALGTGLSIAMKGAIPRISHVGRMLLAIAGLGLFFTATFVFDAYSYWDRASLTRTLPGYDIVGVGAILILLAFLGSGIGNFKALRYLGKISYGLYIYHLPCFVFSVFLGHKLINHYVSLAAIGIGSPLTLALAAVSYRYFESPFLKMKEHFEIVKSRTV